LPIGPAEDSSHERDDVGSPAPGSGGGSDS
jgi:hypothetical protein